MGVVSRSSVFKHRAAGVLRLAKLQPLPYVDFAETGGRKIAAKFKRDWSLRQNRRKFSDFRVPSRKCFSANEIKIFSRAAARARMRGRVRTHAKRSPWHAERAGFSRSKTGFAPSLS
jgi:hypothetical protein